MSDPESIDISQLRLGPIRHESLSPEVLDTLRAVYDLIGPYLDTTLEQFEIGFIRDANPESEVAVWCRITAAWIAYHKQYLDDELLPDNDERDLIGSLIVISTGVRDARKLKVPTDVGQKLIECYERLGEE